VLAAIHLHRQICLQITKQAGKQPKPLLSLSLPFFQARERKETMPGQPWQFSLCLSLLSLVSAIKSIATHIQRQAEHLHGGEGKCFDP